MRALLVCLALVTACDGPDPLPDAGMPDAYVPPPPRVETAYGPVEGRLRDGVQAFLGIPYAAPPVGDLRWRAPQPPEAWTDPYSATARPGRCTQQALGLELASEEDCLYLNIHAPDPLPEGAPVMVWVHGGAFIFGEGLQTDDGTAGDILAREHGVIVVSMNYRLGPLGFMAHPDLTEEGGGASGNYGLMDQRAALEWVRDSIAGFGGDPDDVTLFGESAGGLSVCLHMISPDSRGLFHRAISQSGLCDYAPDDLATAEAEGVAFVEALGCDTAADPIACMRGKSGDELRAADSAGAEVIGSLAGRQWWPIVDGATVPATFRERVLSGDVADVPTIVGWNADEGTLFVMLAEQGGTAVDEATYAELAAGVAETEGVAEADVLAQYPIADYADPGFAAAAIIGDASLACPSRRAAGLLAEAGLDVRVYHFELPDAAFQLATDRDLGAFHSAEIQYVFGHPAAVGRARFTGHHVALNDAMSAAWVAFARGEPDPAWPAYDVATDTHLVFDRTITTGTGADADACALWDVE